MMSRSIEQCSVADCGGTLRARGLCSKHYFRWWKHGDTTVNLKPGGRICAVEGCNRPYHANGYCQMHARRVSSTGSPFVVRKAHLFQRIENPSYIGVHARMRLSGSKTGVCFSCGTAQGKTQMALIPGHGDRADITGFAARLLYSIEPADYREMCCSCHKRMDNATRKWGLA
jgi:hypothetical protein